MPTSALTVAVAVAVARRVVVIRRCPLSAAIESVRSSESFADGPKLVVRPPRWRGAALGDGPWVSTPTSASAEWIHDRGQP